MALLLLASYGDRSAWRSLAEEMLADIQNAIVHHPTAFAQWLSAADFAAGPTFEVAIVGNPQDDRTKALIRTLWKSYRPRQVTAISTYPPGPGTPALLVDRPLIDGRPTAYVCQGFVCRQPTNFPDEMEKQLAGDPIS
jgi:uncharacterized protein YyaL (SSP411 family)